MVSIIRLLKSKSMKTKTIKVLNKMTTSNLEKLLVSERKNFNEYRGHKGSNVLLEIELNNYLDRINSVLSSRKFEGERCY